MFLDEAFIEVLAGKGGDGMVAFRHEKYVPMGGPCGGNGGKGGDIVLVASKDVHTLYDIGQNRIFRAGHGEKGGTGDCTGRSGEDRVILLPVGTLVKDAGSGEILVDLKRKGQKAVIARGGRGGVGNTAFKSSRNQAPRQSTPGAPGEQRKLSLELKLLADCGLVGFPNAGKSSLIRKVSAATPKVADYPFTTLKPALGVVSIGPTASFVLVDIPGLIEGAAEGKGLGHRFLRHIERTRCLVYTIEAAGKESYNQYKILRKELEKFHPLLLEKPKLVVLTKNDLGEFPVDARFKKEKCPVILTSSITGLGLEAFKREAYALSRGSRPSDDDGWAG